MAQALTASDPGDDVILFVTPLLRDDQHDVLANRLAARITEETLGGGVPRSDDPGERLANDRVVRGIHDRRETEGGLLVGRERRIGHWRRASVRPGILASNAYNHPSAAACRRGMIASDVPPGASQRTGDEVCVIANIPGWPPPIGGTQPCCRGSK